MKALNQIKPTVTNQRGQGLIEYLIIVALMGAATIGIMRVMSGTVISKFANVTSALQSSGQKYDAPTLTKDLTSAKDMRSFMEGARDRGQGQAQSKNAGNAQIQSQNQGSN